MPTIRGREEANRWGEAAAECIPPPGPNISSKEVPTLQFNVGCFQMEFQKVNKDVLLVRETEKSILLYDGTTALVGELLKLVAWLQE